MGTVTLRAIDESWRWAVQEVGRQGGVVTRIPAGADEMITVELHEVTVQEAMTLLGTYVDRYPHFKDGVIHWGDDAVSSVNVVGAGYLGIEDASKVLQEALGQHARVRAAGSTVYVAGDDNAASRSQLLGDIFAHAEPSQWRCDVWFVELSATMRQRIGVDLALSGSVDAVLSASTMNHAAAMVLALGLEAEATSSHARLLNSGAVVLIEGNESTLRNVTSMPVPERRTSSEGTVTTTGFTIFDAGVVLDLKASAMPDDRVRLQINAELSSISDFVEEMPIIRKRSSRFDVMAMPGEYVMVAGLDEWSEHRERLGIFGMKSNHSDSMASVVIVLRISKM